MRRGALDVVPARTHFDSKEDGLTSRSRVIHIALVEAAKAKDRIERRWLSPKPAPTLFLSAAPLTAFTCLAMIDVRPAMTTVGNDDATFTDAVEGLQRGASRACSDSSTGDPAAPASHE